MLDYDFEQSIGYWMVMGAEAFKGALAREVSPHGITFRQCQVLGYLALHTPLSQSELAERMGIEPPTLVGILDRMERDGWLSRQSCPEDRRKKLIYPLPAAEPVWAKIVSCAKEVRRRAAQDLEDGELDTLKRLLAKVMENLTMEQTTV